MNWTETSTVLWQLLTGTIQENYTLAVLPLLKHLAVSWQELLPSPYTLVLPVTSMLGSSFLPRISVRCLKNTSSNVTFIGLISLKIVPLYIKRVWPRFLLSWGIQCSACFALLESSIIQQVKHHIVVVLVTSYHATLYPR